MRESPSPLTLRVRRILYPTDFSRHAARALGPALVWSRRFEAQLDVLHVVPLPEDEPGFPRRYASDTAEVWPRTKQRALAELERAVPHDVEGIGLRHSVARHRSPALAIARHVGRRDIDLVVMGTAGRHGVRALCMGSVTERAIREARCPILAVPPRAERGLTTDPTRVLVPIDFSPFASQAARHATAVAHTFETELLYLHVIENPLMPAFYERISHPGRSADRNQDRARAALVDLDREAGGGSSAEFHVVPGRAAEDIAVFADTHGVDLIVIPTHGLSALDRLLVGSVASNVVRRARCPVLVLSPYGKQIVASDTSPTASTVSVSSQGVRAQGASSFVSAPNLSRRSGTPA